MVGKGDVEEEENEEDKEKQTEREREREVEIKRTREKRSCHVFIETHWYTILLATRTWCECLIEFCEKEITGRNIDVGRDSIGQGNHKNGRKGNKTSKQVELPWIPLNVCRLYCCVH